MPVPPLAWLWKATVSGTVPLPGLATRLVIVTGGSTMARTTTRALRLAPRLSVAVSSMR